MIIRDINYYSLLFIMSFSWPPHYNGYAFHSGKTPAVPRGGVWGGGYCTLWGQRYGWNDFSHEHQSWAVAEPDSKYQCDVCQKQIEPASIYSLGVRGVQVCDDDCDDHMVMSGADRAHTDCCGDSKPAADFPKGLPVHTWIGYQSLSDAARHALLVKAGCDVNAETLKGKGMPLADTVWTSTGGFSMGDDEIGGLIRTAGGEFSATMKNSTNCLLLGEKVSVGYGRFSGPGSTKHKDARRRGMFVCSLETLQQRLKPDYTGPSLMDELNGKKQEKKEKAAIKKAADKKEKAAASKMEDESDIPAELLGRRKRKAATSDGSASATATAPTPAPVPFSVAAAVTASGLNEKQNSKQKENEKDAAPDPDQPESQGATKKLKPTPSAPSAAAAPTATAAPAVAVAGGGIGSGSGGGEDFSKLSRAQLQARARAAGVKATQTVRYARLSVIHSCSLSLVVRMLCTDDA